MADIPQVFDTPGAAFVLLRAGQKYPPIEVAWPDKPHTFAEAQAHARKGGNIGAMALNCHIGLDLDYPPSFEGLTPPKSTKWETRPGRAALRFTCKDRTPEVLARYGQKPDYAQFKIYDPAQVVTKIDKNGKERPAYRQVGEVKLERVYQVIPPSWKYLDEEAKENRADYKMIDEIPPAEISLDWLLSELQRIGLVFSSKIEGVKKSEGALRNFTSRLEATPEGDRNTELNKAAFTLGGLVATGSMEEDIVIEQLAESAKAAGMDSDEIMPTIMSGLEKGKLKPIKPAAGGNKKEDDPYQKMCELIPGWINAHHFKTMADSEIIYRYKDGVYVDDGDRIVKELAEFELDDGCTNKIKNEALGKVQRQTYATREEFNQPGVLNLKNGLLEIETGAFTKHTPSNLSTIQLPVEYNPEAVCPAIDKFLSEVLDPEDRPLVEEILGWILWPAYTVHKAVMLVGSGRNGKGSLLRLMGALLGRDNISDVSLQQLCDNRFMPARLYGKMANLGGDLPAIDISDTAAFKGLTGGDRMTVENKYGQPFEFDNRAKLIFSTNKLPKTPDDTYAFYSRWILIVFKHVFDVQQGTGDEGLDKKLQTPEELSGLLNIALAGLARLRANGWRFSYSKTAEDVELLYKRMSNPVLAFLMDKCEEDPKAYLEKTLFYTAFKDYSQEHSIRPMSQKKFWSELKDQSEIPVSDYRPDNWSPRCVRGVRVPSILGGKNVK